ncbi:PilZ domain-containing protein [Brevundimonas sp. AAP58]|uniref:PilZ domain-containing protein n=1 Tax=Brevundimonas sp. AAP58 TaxID=1523422 RepID=UPI000A497F38|nr:PilZ domain-containing protein [Brevundimonas sp. AAP58]
MFRSQSADRRQFPRTAANARGVVVAPGLEVACVIADTSDGGLKVRLDRALVLPARVIIVDIAAGLAIEAETAWRQGNETGLKRRDQASLKGLVPSRWLAAREAWTRAGGR